MLEVDGRPAIEVMAFDARPFHSKGWPVTFNGGAWEVKRAILHALNREARAMSDEIKARVDTDEDEVAEVARWQRSEEDRVLEAERAEDFRREGD